MIINNIEFQEPDFICADCGNTSLAYKYLDSNKSIQARCAQCGKWFGNIKYDKRDKESIRKDKIKEWLRRDEQQ